MLWANSGAMQTMNFTDPELSTLLDAWAASPDLRERAEGHNIVFEERLDQHRLDSFEHSLSTPCSDHVDLKRKLNDFFETYFRVTAPNVPPTFQSQNTGASMGPLSPEQKLVRIEDITGVISNSRYSLADLDRSLSSADPAVSALLEMFLDQWNLARDRRPTFAAFKDQLWPEINDAAWPHKLRDRLGLADYGVAGGPLSVALMEYTVDEVLGEAADSPDIAHPFCVPTFLDARPNSRFFPTPKDLPAGAPMALFEIWSDEDLIAEVLHSRLSYRRHHIKMFGEITVDGPEVDFRTLRNNHLAALQVAAVRDDFGEEL